MERDQDSRASIVVIEAGAGWPHWITDYQRRAPNASVIAQTASESSSDFAGRALHRLEEIQRGPGRLGVGILLCAERAGEDLRGARRRVAHAIGAARERPRSIRHEPERHHAFGDPGSGRTPGRGGRRAGQLVRQRLTVPRWKPA
jgi:hypothetical protein